jgi:hypothetical protein
MSTSPRVKTKVTCTSAAELEAFLAQYPPSQPLPGVDFIEVVNPFAPLPDVPEDEEQLRRLSVALQHRKPGGVIDDEYAPRFYMVRSAL